VKRCLGASIGRKTVAIAGVLAGRSAVIDFSQLVERNKGETLIESLQTALEKVPAAWRDSDVFIAVSSGDLACADCFEVPFSSEGQIEAISGSLAESRCAGYSAEELATDLQRVSGTKTGSMVQVVSLPHCTLNAIQECVRKILPAARLKTVSAIPIALSRALPQQGIHGFMVGGEGILLANNGNTQAWRSFPVGTINPEQALAARAASVGEGDVTHHAKEIALKGIDGVPVELAAAVAVAIVEPAKSANLLRSAMDAPRSSLARLRGPLTLVGTAAALLLVAAGLFFDKQVRQLETNAAALEKSEHKLWEGALPNEPYKTAALTSRLKRILTQRNKVAEANKYPSALAFWSEMAGVLPNADQVGLSLESLQLSPEGGRLTGKVNKGTGDPLSNASLLESSLNNSESLAARGEFETRESEIVVRMRLDYRQPSPKAAGSAKPVGGGKP
jgi:hypothetical protein